MRSSYLVLVNLNRRTLRKFYVYYNLSRKNFGWYYFGASDLFGNNNVRKLFLTLKLIKIRKNVKSNSFFT